MQVSSRIELADLDSPEVAELLKEHLEGVAEYTPPGGVHALDLDALRAPGITFWGAWRGGALAGCGALKELNARHGELKSMRTARSHLRTGVASALLEHLLAVARKRGYDRLYLETGSGEAFAPALALYRRFGFDLCGPFGSYRENSFSKFMKLDL